ncbi:type II 3-dehydroquinate dehydratase [Sphingomonas daechungensis]|uniref:type II 3-dehydroquinate dehydratase n=1 Tax=Sphingomonas daechungensis TaxID=1176646 RepID=UPI0031F084AB
MIHRRPNAQLPAERKGSQIGLHCQNPVDTRHSLAFKKREGVLAKPGSGSKSRKPATIHVLNGPNLNLLGEREPEVYGTATLADVERACLDLCKSAGVTLEFHQTNSEGSLIDQIQAARHSNGIVINPAGYSYSVAVLDALLACSAPVVEVHISNVHARKESWRAETKTTAAAKGVISGLGTEGYLLALRYILGTGGALS